MEDFCLFALALALVINGLCLLFKFINEYIIKEDFGKSIDYIKNLGLLEIVLIGLFMTGTFLLFSPNELPEGMKNLAPEFIGMSVTILFIERLIERRKQEDRKKDLIEQMNSPIRDIAVEALRIVIKNGWFEEAKKSGGLTHVRWRGAYLKGVDFTGFDIALDRWDLRKAHLEGANLNGVTFIESDLRGVHLEGADLRDVNFIGCDLRKARLQGADLRGASLGRVKMQHAKLASVDFEGALFSDVDFQGATYLDRPVVYPNGTISKKPTNWPEGFCPEDYGLIKTAKGEDIWDRF